jgi:C-terminal processing protease CtpA/Prc
LRPGDEIVKVEGTSILEEAGILQRAEQREQIHLTVRRDGKDMNVVMVVTP